jgi:pyridoxine 5-phosphate synthase
MTGRIRLGINVDHVATLRNARDGTRPDPIRAAKLALSAGADGITAHLREDRRHIRDSDIERLMAEVDAPLNLEMAATADMLAIALRVRPHAACIVPERREERTTEGGLDVVGHKGVIAPIVRELGEAGIRVSLFVQPDIQTLEEAAMLGAPVVELNTGSWTEAVFAEPEKAIHQFEALAEAARHAHKLGLEVHAGHGLDPATAEAISAFPELAELNIGHYLVGEAIFIGLDGAIRDMRAAIDRGRNKAAAA